MEFEDSLPTSLAEYGCGGRTAVKTSGKRLPQHSNGPTLTLKGAEGEVQCGGRFAAGVAQPWKASRRLHRALSAKVKITYKEKSFEV
jgi:hypothetical protein